MSIGQKIVEKLQMTQRMEDQMSFSLKNSAGTEPGYQVEEVEQGIRVRVAVPDLDKYSFKLGKIEVLDERGRDIASPERVLRKQAKFIEDEISYLLETFRLIELDTRANVAQMRSEKPLQKDQARQYYEILLEQGRRLKFSRYEKKPDDEARQAVPFLLTEDTFSRLLDDLARAMWV